MPNSKPPANSILAVRIAGYVAAVPLMASRENDLFLATREIKDVQHSGTAVFNPWTDNAADFPLA